MRFKLFLCSISLLFMLSSCKKNESPAAQVRIASIQETIYSSIPNIAPKLLNYTFEYDEKHRITQVNDRHFKYDSSNKVTESYIKRVTIGYQGITQEFIEKLKFVWDNQKRISTIIADSIYHHHYHKEANGTVTTALKSLYQGSIIAKYEYTGNATLPTSISSLKEYDRPGQSGKLENTSFKYNGNNFILATVSLQPGPLDSEIGFPVSSTALAAYSHYLYQTQANYLYQSYQQLGFHPYDFGSIVPQNNWSSKFVEVQAQNIGASTNPNWDHAENFVSTYNSFGVPSLIQSTASSNGAESRQIIIKYK